MASWPCTPCSVTLTVVDKLGRRHTIRGLEGQHLNELLMANEELLGDDSERPCGAAADVLRTGRQAGPLQACCCRLVEAVLTAEEELAGGNNRHPAHRGGGLTTPAADA